MPKMQSAGTYVLNQGVTQRTGNVAQVKMKRRLQGALKQHGNRLNFERLFSEQRRCVFVVLTPGWDAVKVHACDGQYGFALLTPSLLVENMLAAALVYFVVVRCRE